MKLRTSKKKMALLVAACCAFVSMGVFLLDRQPVVGYFNIVFWGLGGVGCLARMQPDSSYLQLDQNGFTVCSLFRKRCVRWADVEEFFPVRIQLNAMVGWNYIPGYVGQEKGRATSLALCGVEAALPDTYGMKAPELANLLNEWRSKCAEMECA